MPKRKTGLMRGAGAGTLYMGAQPLLMPSTPSTNVSYTAQSTGGGDLASMQADAAKKQQEYQDAQARAKQEADDQATADALQSQQRSAAKQGLYEKVGTGLGSVLGSAFGPVGTFVGGTLGDLAGLGLSKLF